MWIDEKELRENLEKKFSLHVVSEVILALKEDGLPVKIATSDFDFEIGESVHIKFLGNDGSDPKPDEILKSCNWLAEIEGIDPIQIKSIRIPELNYDEPALMLLDISLYPFKIQTF